MAHGRVVADGPTDGDQGDGRHAHDPRDAAGRPTLEELERLPGVTRAERRGEASCSRCTDSDAAIRALLAAYPDARDIEISGAGLEEAFLELTGGETR